MNAPVLELEGVGRRYGSRFAVQPVDLRLGRGSVCLVHGDNGAGKTTFLRLAAGLLAPSCGRRLARDRSLYLRPGSGVRSRQRVADGVRTAACLAGDPSRVHPALARAGLDRLADQRIVTLSAGQRGRLLVALALATRPGLVCLDEPAAHLDAAGTDLIWSVVAELADDGSAVVVATPNRARPGLVPDARLTVADGLVRAET